MQAAVVGVPDHYRGEAVKAFVVLKDGPTRRPSAGEIIDFCRERLTPYKAPRLLEFRTELPMTTTGTLLRRELRRQVSLREEP